MTGILDWIEARESLLSGIAAIFAVLGVLSVSVVRMAQRVRSARNAAAQPTTAAEPADRAPARPAGQAAFSIGIAALSVPTADDESAALARGLSDEIANAFSRLSGVRAVSLIDAGADTSDLAALRRDYHLQYLVSGSLHAATGRVRVLARLTNVDDGSQTWGGDYDREAHDLFDLQREIAGAIAKQVGGELMHAEYQRMRHVDPKHLDAWTLTAHSAHIVLERRGGSEVFDEAIDCAHRAIEIEPDYAPALARLATLSAERIANFASKDPQSDHATALESAERAYRLASFDPYVLMNCGQAWSICGRAPRSRQVLDQAIEMVPYDLLARFFHANHIALWGTEADAADTVRLLPPLLVQHRSHPVTLLLRGSLALCQLRIGAEQEAIDGLRECYEAAPGIPTFGSTLAAILLRRGEAEEALHIAEHLTKLGFDLSAEYRDRWRSLGPTLSRFEELVG